MKRIDLEYFRTPQEWLDEDFAPFLTKAAMTCFTDQNHLSGTEVQVKTNEGIENWTVEWDTISSKKKNASLPNSSELTQKGAEAVALCLAKELEGYPYFETARIGTRVDFWLKKNQESFSFEAGLEVSGILRKSQSNTIKKRIDQKKKRILTLGELQHDYFISVVEFSTPSATFLKV